MRWARALGAALAILLAAACGDDPAAPSPEPSETAALTVATAPSLATSPPSPAPTDTAGPAPTSTVPVTTTTPAVGEPAPDFALELGNGGTFLLSEEARPVFMVFWAEW